MRPEPAGSLSALLTECRAGDVLLTGHRGGLSAAINWAGKSPVSHAMLVVAPGVAVEARDPRWDLKESGMGIRLVRIESLSQLGFSYVAACRPRKQPDANAIRLWAADVVRRPVPFASVGLTAMAPLLLATQLEAQARRWGSLRFFVQPFLRGRRRRLAELVADGTHRVICAELVYRGLLSGGVEVDLSVAQFAESLRELPHATAHDANHPTSGASAVPTESELFEQASASHVLSKAALPKPTWRYLISALNSGVRQFFRRAGRDHRGDKADLVTPADLLRSASMMQLWEWSAK